MEPYFSKFINKIYILNSKDLKLFLKIRLGAVFSIFLSQVLGLPDVLGSETLWPRVFITNPNSSQEILPSPSKKS